MRRSLITLTFVGAALIGLVGAGSIVEAAHPPAPSPCAADGICRPKTATWGHWNTHWRPWPGDTAALPTPAKAAVGGPGEEKNEQLRGFQPPLPQKEDQIGPEKEERGEKSLPAGAEPPAVPAVPELPGEPAGAAPDALPAIDPFGDNDLQPLPSASVVLRSPVVGQPSPQPPTALPLPPTFHKQPAKTSATTNNAAPIDLDAPPALPASLLRVAKINRNRGAAHPHVRHDAKVRRTSAESASGIRIINPAAALVAEPGAEGLQQAIYFEAAKAESPE